ncbi:hypothetical protein CDD83_665 [Cordyceps sp. RAO-2017]|nr:hypothetical protein CDD83_665 [Cordyceps sp. RAO-2017]
MIEHSLCGEGAAAAAIEHPKDPKQRWWWDRIAPLLASMLRSSGGYSPEALADHMCVLRDVVIPTLGLPNPEAAARPLLTLDGSPFESSWNFTATSDDVIRYTFEPLGNLAGSPEDPFAGDLIPSLVPVLAKAASGADMRWFRQIMEAWVLLPEEAAVARKKLPPNVSRIPQLFVAFDMKGPRRLLKAYFFPMLKHFAYGTPTETMALDMIRSLEPCGERLAPAAEKLMKSLERRSHPCPVEMMAIDCIDPTKARVKVYARTQANSLAALREGLTLGGVQTDELTMKGVDAACKIWHLLLDERQGLADEAWSKPPREPHTLHKGICFVYELRAGQDRVEVKAHMPYCQSSASDQDSIDNFAEALRTMGWPEAASKYQNGAKKTESCL